MDLSKENAILGFGLLFNVIFFFLSVLGSDTLREFYFYFGVVIIFTSIYYGLYNYFASTLSTGSKTNKRALLHDSDYPHYRSKRPSLKKEPVPLSGDCAFCHNTIVMPYRCSYCSELFCPQHRLPENHQCSGIRPKV